MKDATIGVVTKISTKIFENIKNKKIIIISDELLK